jgi:probable phosphoglycerate mutase
MRLYLIRHGETQYNATGRFQGWAEIPLNDNGIQQAARLAERMEQFPLDAIYTSDLRRTVMTATLVAAHSKTPLIHEPLFRERNPGDLTDQPYEAGMEFFEDDSYDPPNGESVEMFRNRVAEATDSLIEKEGHTDRQIAVVTHGMFCSSFARHQLMIDPFEDPDFHWANTCLSVCDFEDGKWSTRFLADATHLDDTDQPNRSSGA